MYRTQFPMQCYKTPCSPAYWREARASSGSLRNLMFAALMVAACMILANYSIYLSPSLRITFSFLARAVCALVYGPLGVLGFAAVEDTLGFLIAGKGYPYFPGYMLSTMLGCLIYALCFYRARLSVARVVLAKVSTNLLNVFLGSLWNVMLYGKGYWVYVAASAWKNAAMLIPEIILLTVLLQGLVPVLQKLGLIPIQLKGRMPWI